MAIPGQRPEIRQAKTAVRDLTRLRVRRRRSANRQWRVRDALWEDPYPWVWGTLPEKLVFAWLANHGIPFVYQGAFPDCPDTETIEAFRPDFMLPVFKVIIEVQGEYWHSQVDQAEHDAYKFAVYDYMGWAVYWFWETDILTDLAQLMGSVSQISGYGGVGGWTWESRIDDLKALRLVNSNSRQAPAPALAYRSERKRR